VRSQCILVFFVCVLCVGCGTCRVGSFRVLGGRQDRVVWAGLYHLYVGVCGKREGDEGTATFRCHQHSRGDCE
jgi:hypothetical protein